MQLIFLIFLISSSAFAAESVSQQAYSNLNKPFLLDRRLKSKIATIATENKILDFTKVSELIKQNAKIEKAFEVLKKQFMADLEKKFSKEEIAYLNKTFSHSLLVRLVDFQNNFTESEKNNKLILETLKKDTAAASK